MPTRPPSKKTKKKTKYIAVENVLEEFYLAIASDNPSEVERIHIPRSDVFYCRTAYEAATGHKITLDRMERALYLEGMLDRRDVLDPDRKRDWE